MKYGLWDEKEQCWLGNSEGPKSYDDLELARVAAQVADVMLRQEPGRTRAKPFPERPLRLKDHKDAAMSAEEALRQLESGEAI